MATLTVGDITPRVQYTASAGQTTFAYAFPIFANTDLKVYIGSTLKTLTTHYSVTGAGSSSGGNVVLGTGASAGEVITIYRDLPVARTSDYQTGGTFRAETLNDDLDKVVMMAQQLEDQVNNNTLTVDQFDDTSIDLTLPVKDTRKGTVLGFNATSGAPEAGPTIANVNSLAAITANINTVAGIHANVTTVANNDSNVSTVAGISGNVTTVAGISGNVTTVAGNNANVTTVASNIASVNTVAGNITEVVAVANDLAEAVSEIETVANDLNETTSEIDTVANNIANVNTVGGISGNVTTVAGIASNVTTVAGNNANVSAVGGISANVTTVAGIASNVTSVAGNAANINKVAAVDSDVSAVAAIDSNVTTVAGNNSNVSAVAGAITNINTTASNIADVNNFAEKYRISGSAPTSSLNEGDLWWNSTAHELRAYNTGTSSWAATAPSASSQAAIDIVAGDIVYSEDLGSIASALTTGTGNSITTVGNNISSVTAVAGAMTNVNTVAGAVTNVNNVGGSIANVNTVATGLADVNRYANEYTISNTAPSSPSAGDLWYDGSANVLKYYSGSGWGAISAGINDVVDDTTPQLGGALDGQNNNMTNIGTISGSNLQLDFGGL